MTTAIVATAAHVAGWEGGGGEYHDKPTAASRFLTNGRRHRRHHLTLCSGGGGGDGSSVSSPGSSSHQVSDPPSPSSSSLSSSATAALSGVVVVVDGKSDSCCCHRRSSRTSGGAGWLSCSCIDPEEMKEAEEYQPQENDPYYTYMLGNGDKTAKTQAYVGKGRNPFWKRAGHNCKRFRTKKTRSAAGKWFLELICGPFQSKEDSIAFKKAWSKSRGVDSKRARALRLALEYRVTIYDFRLPCAKQLPSTPSGH